MSNTNQQQYAISLLVNNKPGVLIRISLVFARRGYNLESVVVSPTNDPEFSRMSLVASGEAKTFDQIIKQLNKLVDVIHATEHSRSNSVEKEMALIKVQSPMEKRTEILQIVEHFKGMTVDISGESLMIQVTGNSDKLDAVQTVLDKYTILEYVRSGKLIMARGDNIT
jgi:acetolactate synthase-1/3 small subunit